MAHLTESHPAWVRGLKQSVDDGTGSQVLSHPAWVRGLKPENIQKEKTFFGVAPCVGAWIETEFLLT